MLNQSFLITFIFAVCLLGSIICTEHSDAELILHWSFDELNGDTLSDSSKEGNDGMLIGTASVNRDGGMFGGALMLDGSDGSAEDENGADYINDLDAFSISVWVKSDSVGHDRGIVFGKNPEGSDNIFGMRYDKSSWDFKGGTNVIKAGITVGETEQRYESANDTQTTDWQHLVLIWSSGEQLLLYINGEMDEPLFNSDAADGMITGAEKLVIGKGAKDNQGTSWTGLIDEIRIYASVLTEIEIAHLYDSNATSVEASNKLATTWATLKK